MIWKILITWLTQNWKKVFVVLLSLVVIVILLKSVSQTMPNRVWVFGPKERVTIKIR